ncbi:MAG: CNNM domain-containing protein [Gemmataceae bacterium]
MTLLVIAVLVVLCVSAVCSLTEAALYAVRISYIRHLSESGSLAGKTLAHFRRNMEQPITAILIVNTVANTAGAAIAGAQAQSIFGEMAVIWFTAIFTTIVLLFSEILPKVVGVAYSQSIATVVAVPLSLVVRAMRPAVWLVQRLFRVMRPRVPLPNIPEEEVQQIVRMSAEEGSILPLEAKLVQNVLKLDEVRAADIMTPRTVVGQLPANMTLREVNAKVKEWTHSRIPIYDENDPETWVGIVLTRDILTRLANDEFTVTLRELCKPLFFVSEKTPGHVLLKAFLRRRTHLFGVMHERGSLVGIVTLEDVMEALIGEEILDEMDTVVDLQEVARRRRRQQFEKANADENALDV